MESEIERQVRSCPLNGRVCCDGVREDFDKNPVTKQPIKCRWWVHLVGQDPQTQKPLDQFDCSLAWLPIIGVENSAMIRNVQASTDKVASQVSKTRSAFIVALPEDARARLEMNPPALIEAQDAPAG